MSGIKYGILSRILYHELYGRSDLLSSAVVLETNCAYQYRLTTRLGGQSGPINCLQFTQDGELLASGGTYHSL